MSPRESKMLSGMSSVTESIKTNKRPWRPVMPYASEVLPCVSSTILWGKYYSVIHLAYKEAENREAKQLTQGHTARKQDPKMKPIHSGLCSQSFLGSSLPLEDCLLFKIPLRSLIFQKNLKSFYVI